MPVFTSHQSPPEWCELREFGIHDVPDGECIEFPPGHARSLFICTAGALELLHAGTRIPLALGVPFELTRAVAVTIKTSGASQLVRVAGRWTQTSGAGIFTVRNGPPAAGDPPSFGGKSTPFDNHYHDCDEYWIFLDGSALVCSEGQTHRVSPGDCVATGMGWHHDVLRCERDSGIRAVWFEAALEGRRRPGHLYDSVHGPAEPQLARV